MNEDYGSNTDYSSVHGVRALWHLAIGFATFRRRQTNTRVD